MSHVIIVDIDHTLLNNQGDLLAENVHALREAKKRGNIILLATARSHISTVPIYKALELTTPLIVSNGTLVVNIEGNILRTKNILPSDADRAFKLFTQTPHHWVVRIANTAYVHPEFDRSHEPYSNEEFYRPLDFALVNEFLGNFDNVVSLSLYGDDSLKAFCKSYNWQSLGLRTSYYAPSYYDKRNALSVFSKEASKGEALQWLLADLEITNLPTLIIGDSPDDVSMFHLGKSVAPSSGSSLAKEKANWIGPSCDEAVVAAAIEKFIFT